MTTTREMTTRERTRMQILLLDDISDLENADAKFYYVLDPATQQPSGCAVSSSRITSEDLKSGGDPVITKLRAFKDKTANLLTNLFMKDIFWISFDATRQPAMKDSYRAKFNDARIRSAFRGLLEDEQKSIESDMRTQFRNSGTGQTYCFIKLPDFKEITTSEELINKVLERYIGKLHEKLKDAALTAAMGKLESIAVPHIGKDVFDKLTRASLRNAIESTLYRNETPPKQKQKLTEEEQRREEEEQRAVDKQRRIIEEERRAKQAEEAIAEKARAEKEKAIAEKAIAEKARAEQMAKADAEAKKEAEKKAIRLKWESLPLTLRQRLEKDLSKYTYDALFNRSDLIPESVPGLRMKYFVEGIQKCLTEEIANHFIQLVDSAQLSMMPKTEGEMYQFIAKAEKLIAAKQDAAFSALQHRRVAPPTSASQVYGVFSVQSYDSSTVLPVQADHKTPLVGSASPYGILPLRAAQSPQAIPIDLTKLNAIILDSKDQVRITTDGEGVFLICTNLEKCKSISSLFPGDSGAYDQVGPTATKWKFTFGTYRNNLSYTPEAGFKWESNKFFRYQR